MEFRSTGIWPKVYHSWCAYHWKKNPDRKQNMPPLKADRGGHQWKHYFIIRLIKWVSKSQGKFWFELRFWLVRVVTNQPSMQNHGVMVVVGVVKIDKPYWEAQLSWFLIDAFSLKNLLSFNWWSIWWINYIFRPYISLCHTVQNVHGHIWSRGKHQVDSDGDLPKLTFVMRSSTTVELS